MTTHDPVRFWAVVQPDRVALRGPRTLWTYGDLDRAVWRAADALLERGLGSGEHVSLEFAREDGIALAVALHATQRIGLLPVVIGAEATDAERQAMRERAQVDFTLTAGDLDIPHLDEGGAEAPGPDASPRSAANGAADDAAPARRSSRRPETTGSRPGSGPGSIPGTMEDLYIERRLDAPGVVCFTSGTSGEPRAVVLTHGNLLWSALGSARYLGVRGDDVWLCCMPLHHIGGLSILVRSALYGTTALLHDRFDPDAVHDAIDRGGVTLASLVPTMLKRLLEARRGARYPESLRAVLVGGGPVPAERVAEASELALRALPTYGLTEAASQVSTLPSREWPRGLTSAGRPLPFTRVEIRDGNDRAAGAGVEGEIVVRGPTVMAGYLGDPVATAAALRARWLRTGDVGMWDEAGRLVVLDRRVDRIVTGGENVAAEEVERVLETHPSVAAACVVGIPSAEWGQEVAAAVALRPGRTLSLEELRTHAGGTLAAHKVPRRLWIAPDLPRSAAGKLLRRVVRERFLDEMAKQKHP